MRTVPYNHFPTKQAWIGDSKVRSLKVWRGQDHVLLRLDSLLKDVETAHDAGEVNYICCELYFAANYWIRNYLATTSMCNDREPAVRMLRDFAEGRLAHTFNCGRMAVDNKLRQHYAKTITPHGVWCDRRHSHLPLARREKFRLFFEHGKAYWVEWWKNRDSVTLARVNTELAFESTYQGKRTELIEDWAYFALSFHRDIYVGPHKADSLAGGMPAYHSSYLAGVPVQFAGSIHIVDGKVKGIRNDSGHYQPNDKFFINVLAQLKTVGVNLDEVELYDHDCNRILRGTGDPYRAADYLRHQGKWELVLDRGTEFLRDQQALKSARNRKIVFGFIYPGGNNGTLRFQDDEDTDRRLSEVVGKMYYWRVAAGEKAGALLWRDSWRQVCQAVMDFMSPDDTGLNRYRRAWDRRMRNEAKPPRPEHSAAVQRKYPELVRH